MSEIPQWAINEALKRCGVDPTEIPFADWRDRTYAKAVELFAAHIAEHEEPPVDPLLVEARRVAMGTGNWSPDYAEQMVEGELDDSPVVRAALAALRRGMELAREQSK